MLTELPDDAVLASHFLGRLAAELSQQIARYRYLMAIDKDFGEGVSVMLPGGNAAYHAFIEARSCYVAGNFVATIFLCQAVVEQALAAHLGLVASVAQIHGMPTPSSGWLTDNRPELKNIISKALELDLIKKSDEVDVRRLCNLRNPLAHFRSNDDQGNIDRRAIQEQTNALELLENDAKFAITTALRLVHSFSRWIP